jgi:serine/threonine protein phosphatase PrpC
MISCGRVMNRLAVTRAFGDFEFKTLIGDNGEVIRKKYICVDPEVR